jgi:RNA polymerase sigma-70 factor (ECF subfamily)
MYESAFKRKSWEVGNVEDTRIIELYFQRDQQAIKETDKKYGKLCHSIAYNLLGDAEDCKECVNDTYMGIWSAIPPARPENFISFVCKVARNQAIKRLEAAMRHKRSDMTLVSFDELEEVMHDGDVSDKMSEKELGKAISRFLKTQKTDARNVFLRRYYFFDSIKEIAKRYGFTESKVKNMLLSIRNKLKDYLIKEGFIYENT